MATVKVEALAHILAGGTHYTIDDVLIGSSAGILISSLSNYSRGAIIRGGATVWEAYGAAVDGAILIGDGTDIVSDTTPSIAGLVTLRGGAVLAAGQTFDANGAADAFVLDTDADTTISAPTDDQIDIEISGADDFTLTANAFNVLSGSNIIMADDTAIGINAAGRLVFNSTPNPDQVAVTDADLYIATASHGIIHADGVAAGYALVADGTRYVPSKLVANVPFAPTAQGDMIVADATSEWGRLALAGGAGYALVSTAATVEWDQTPTWTGLHTFAAGITFSGASGANNVTIPDNTAIAVELLDAGGIEYLRIVTTDTGPTIKFNDAGADIDFKVEAVGVLDALEVQGSDGQVTVGGLGAGVVQTDANGVLSSATLLGIEGLSDPGADRLLFWDDSETSLGWLMPADEIVISGTGISINHDACTNFVANEHINHTSVTLAAGNGLTGGGDISASRTFTVGAGNGITVNANDVALTTPGTCTVATGNSAAGNHTHAITSSSNPGANASILATDASGYLQLVGLGIGVAAGAANRITIVDGGSIGQAAGPLLTFDDTNNYLEIMGCNIGAGTATPVNAKIVVANAAATAIEIQRTGGASSIKAGSTDGYLMLDSNGQTLRLNNYVSDDVIIANGGGDAAIGTKITSGKLHVDQASASGAKPVLYLDQGDVSEQCIQFSSDGADRDIHLWTVNVTGTPHLDWDESENTLVYGVETAATTTITELLTLEQASTGSTNIGFGSSIMLRQESNSGAIVDAAQIAASWSIHTGGAESALFRFTPMHGGARIGDWALYPLDGIGGGALTVISGGAYDVTKLLYYTAIVHEEGGAGVAGPTGTLTPGNTVDLYDDGTDVLTLAIDAGGQVTVSVTAGEETFTMLIALLWI